MAVARRDRAGGMKRRGLAYNRGMSTLARSIAALAAAMAVGIGLLAAGAQGAAPLWQVRHTGDGFDDGRVAAARARRWRRPSASASWPSPARSMPDRSGRCATPATASTTAASPRRATSITRRRSRRRSPRRPSGWRAPTTLRRQVRVALGLWPWPERTPLQRGRPRTDRPRRLHDRARRLRERAGALGHRQPVPPDRPHRPPARGAGAARTLAGRTASGALGRRREEGDGVGRRADARGRALSAAGAAGDAGADGRDRVRVGHGRLRRQHRDRAPRRLHRRRRRAAAPELPRALDVERGARRRLPADAARRRPGAHRHQRRQRRRHAEPAARRDRRSRRHRRPGGDGVGQHAGRLHLRERDADAARHQQHRAHRAGRAAAARRGRRQRLDDRLHDEGAAGAEDDLCADGRARRGRRAEVRVPAQRQPGEPRIRLRLVQPRLQARPAGADARAAVRAGAAGAAPGLRRGASAAGQRARRGRRPPGDDRGVRSPS